MQDIDTSQLKEREEELESTLKNLAELIESRNNVLSYFEKNTLKKILNHMFSNLNASSRGNMLNGMILIIKRQ